VLAKIRQALDLLADDTLGMTFALDVVEIVAAALAHHSQREAEVFKQDMVRLANFMADPPIVLLALVPTTRTCSPHKVVPWRGVF
jgi:propanediol dehydratase large subunit